METQFLVDVSETGTGYYSAGLRSSVDELTVALHAAATHKSPVAPIVISTAAATLLALVIQPWLAILVGVLGIAVFVWAKARAACRRRVGVLYRLDGSATEAFEALSNGAGWLASSRAVWHVTHEEETRRPANLTSMNRAAAEITRAGAANLVTNVEVFSLVTSGETMHFLPDALLIRDHGSIFIDVAYASIRVDLKTVRFSESQAVPSDSHRVGTGWLFSNKNGGPDRRRANNREIPVLEYARVALSWERSGCVLLVSNVEAARHFANALQTMAKSRAARPIVPRPAAVIAQSSRIESSIPARPSITSVIAPLGHPPSQAAVNSPPRGVVVDVARREDQQTAPAEPSATTDLARALQASIDRLQQQQQQRSAVGMQHEPIPPSATQTTGVWIAEGRSETVDGFATGSFVYVGNVLRTLNGLSTEPSLINPALPVDRSLANTTGIGMSYWPSYSSVSSASRRAYLQWLACGRNDPNAYIGYVFIFFYGLERRVYEFTQSHGSNADEVLAIGREVARLFRLYSPGSGSFRSYASALLDLIATLEPRARDIARSGEAHAFGPSSRWRLALGELALASKPIPAGHALEWVRSSYSLATPAQRCAREFELLFHIRYAKRFGEGMLITPNKTCLDLTYRPASSGLALLSLTHGRIPDVTRLTRPLAKLIEVAQECTSALDPFSRFLGKNPEGRESLAAFALLPHDLVEATPSTDASSLASLVRSRLDEGGRAHLAAAELLPFVRVANPEKISKNEATLLAQALEKLGYGVEPDVRLGGPVYEVNGRVVVFRRLPDCPSAASQEYATATLCMRLGALVSASDDDVSEAERALLQRQVAVTLQLSEGERQRLSAHLAWLLDAQPGTHGLKRPLSTLTAVARRHIGSLLITVGAADGHVDPREMKMLEKLYGLIGLDTATLYADIHAALASDDAPVTIEPPASGPTGFAIPPKPAPATAASGIDMNRVRLKIAETRQVSTLLSSIFIEEETPPAVAPAIAQAGTIGTLDAGHSELLRRLARRESWPRAEIERLAAELALLPDGALETINDYAYATAAEPFWEDDDPVAINSSVAMELIA